MSLAEKEILQEELEKEKQDQDTRPSEEGSAEVTDTEDGTDNKYILTPVLVKREGLLPNQANEKFALYDIEELAESIRVFSLLQPLHVKQRSDGKYDIISGHRRFLAVCLLQDKGLACYKDGIPCVYSNVAKSKLDEMILVYEANIHSRKYGMEYIHYIRDLYNLYLEKQNVDEQFRKESGNLANYLGLKLGFKENSRQSKKYINIFDRAEQWIWDALDDKDLYRKYDISNSQEDRANCRIAENGELKKGMTIDEAVIITNLNDQADREALHRLYEESGSITKETLDRYRKIKGKNLPETEFEDNSYQDTGIGIQATDDTGKPGKVQGSTASHRKAGNKVTDGEVDLSAYRDDDYTDMPGNMDAFVRQHAAYNGEEDYNGYIPEDDYDGYEPGGYSSNYGKEEYEGYEDDYSGEGKTPGGYEGFSGSDDMGFGSLGGFSEVQHDSMKDGGTDVLLWFSELSAKKEISPYDRVMVDSVLTEMADFYFPLYSREGYIKEEMIPVLRKIADIINPLLQNSEDMGFLEREQVF